MQRIKKDPTWLILLREKYGRNGSFALWPHMNNNDPNSISYFIESNINICNPSVVLVGLNPTIDTTLLNPWCAFHYPGNDKNVKRMSKWLPYLPFKGAYMTDIVKDVVNRDSSKVISQWDNDVLLRKRSEMAFLEEMDILKQNDPAVFLFGGRVEKIWSDTSLGKKFRSRKIWHYSHQKKNSDMIKSWDDGAKFLGFKGYKPQIDSKFIFIAT